MNQIKLASQIIWLMEILKIQQEEQLHIERYYILRNKAFNITKNPNYDVYQRDLALWCTNILKNGIKDKQLFDELHKPIIRKFKKRKVYSSFKDNILGC